MKAKVRTRMDVRYRRLCCRGRREEKGKEQGKKEFSPPASPASHVKLAIISQYAKPDQACARVTQNACLFTLFT